MISKGKKEKHFKLNLEKDLKTLGYNLNDMSFEKNEEDNIYSFLLHGTTVIYFDEYKFFEYFIQFFNQGIKVCILGKPIEINNSVKAENYLRAEYDRKNLEGYKEKIRQLLEVDKKTSITAIAQELGITRQGLYKNLELKKYIDTLKKD